MPSSRYLFLTQDLFKQASLDSQKLQADVRQVRGQLTQLQQQIEGKAESIVREMNPRIDQLEEKMRTSWGSIEGMDRVSW